MTNSPVDPLLALGLFALLVAFVALLAWPRRGVLSWLTRLLRSTDRVLAEDSLKLLFHRARPVAPAELASALGLPQRRLERVLGRLLASGLITTAGGALSLSDGGRAYAVHIIRAHRLWERYLADRTGVPIARWHSEAEQKEHFLSPAETEALYERMGRPAVDPHGDPIPLETGQVPELPGQPLPHMAAGRSAEIVHLEDEPDAAYQRLLAAGLSVGDRLTMTQSDAAGVRFRTSGRDVSLSTGDAEGVTVRAVEEPAAAEPVRTLADTRGGETAVVIGLSPACIGPERRRLLDLGIVPDTEITAEMSSALGEPIAYRIRGALIALRRHQAAWVLVKPAAERQAA